jgi:hypothetical protein
MIAERESTRDTQDTFVNHLLKKNYGIFSEATASLASMVVTALKCKPFLKLRSKKSHQALFYPFWQIFHF